MKMKQKLILEFTMMMNGTQILTFMLNYMM